MPRDAEAWLAERGIAREPIRLTPNPDEVAHAGDAATTEASSAAGSEPAGSDGAEAGPVAQPDVAAQPGHGPPPSAREAAQLAAASAASAADAAATAAAQRPVGGASLSDDVAAALAFIRRSTATVPQSVGRLREKLADRDTPASVIDLAVERAHAEGLVDDEAMAAALVDEGRAKGHAPTRLRADLTRRGFDRDVIERAVAVTDGEDLSAAAFAVAQERAERLTAMAPETAVRRIVGQLARRGYPEALARKVARDAVFTSRDPARTAGH